MRPLSSSSVARTRVVCLILSYVLVATMLAPATGSAAKPATLSSAGKKTPAAQAAATIAPLMSQAAAGREGEVLVRFRAEVSEGEKESLAAAQGARRRGRLRGASGFERLGVEAGGSAQALMAQLATQGSVEWVEPNYLINRDDLTSRSGRNLSPDYAPTYPRGLERWGAAGQMGTGLSAPALPWQPAPASPQMTTDVVIAVIDSGVDFTHPDLASREWTNSAERANNRDDDRDGYIDDLHGWDWVAGGNQIRDEQGHGTAVAGIIAAHSSGPGGSASPVSLMSLRVLDGTGIGDVADAVEAIDYAVAHGAQIINLSWGLETSSLALRDAIARAGNRGILVVASAGNGGRNIDGMPYYPASYALQNMLAVAASDSSDNLASWSNWGATQVAIAAPGVDVQTVRMGGGEQKMNGTSAAAPMVAGIAGRLKTVSPGLSANNMRAAIITGARQVTQLSGKVVAGGVADEAGALMSASGMGNGGGGGHGNGNGGNGGNGGGQGGGNGPGRGPNPPTGRPAHGSGGRGPKGSFDAPASPPTKAPPAHFMNQDEARRQGEIEPEAPAFIQSNSLPHCDADCDGYSPGGAGGSDPYFGTARNLPENRTGQTAGVDLGSRNFNWNLPLVSLKGRAGLDLNIALHYNSLVWTKQGGSIQYNADHGFPGPGFHLGFPTLQPLYSNSGTGMPSYTMVTTSGGRVEMRQLGGTNTYESADGTYTHLTVDNNGGAVVRTSDGTQLTFVFNAAINEYRCTQIKDRNGNFITINYGAINGDSSLGRPTSVTDTLGHTLTFNYDTQNYLISITQVWNRDTLRDGYLLFRSATHEWARFSYGTITLQPNFRPEMGVVAPTGTAIPVLSRVILSDKSYYQFDYEAGWGMVRRISHYGPGTGSRLLSYTSYNLPTTQTQHDDCPRFTERRDWGMDWNGDVDGVPVASEEAVTTYAVTPDASWTMDSVLHTGTRTTVTSPVFYDKDNVAQQVVEKVYAHSTGWDSGLPRQTETYQKNTNNGVETLQRKVTTAWTQDDTALSYAKNPRPTEHIVFDEAVGHRKRTEIVYGSYSLPAIIKEYGFNDQMLARQTNFDYNPDPVYLNNRIIGLLSVKEVYRVLGSTYTMMSRDTYDYDSGALADPGTVKQHDTSYGVGLVAGRGNLTATHRFDMTDPYNTALMTNTSTGYDAAGNAVWTKDGANHQTSISYEDNYSHSTMNSHNTRAFPTRVTDPDGYFSTVKYNYDLSALYSAIDPKGATERTFYDSAGRVLRVDNGVDDASSIYTRYEYDLNWGHTRSYTPTETGEAYTNTIRDGAGQVRLFVAGHPNSTGMYLATRTKYDALGRAVEQSNPTEIYSDGTPAGDDAAGYRWTKQAYDWKGRPTLTTFPAIAGQTLGNTKEVTYTGCGCAGGEVTTFRDERGRRRVLSKDIFGRLVTVEEMNWDGTTAYATTDYGYNALDRLTIINQNGLARNFEYDGHGRLKARRTPEQGWTRFTYNADDTVETMTDARNVTTSFVYNNRGLVTNINYTIPGGSNVAATSNVTFGYDEAGNRTSMNNGIQQTQYHYDQLSRMDYEEVKFPGLNSTWHRLSYGYNKAGQLTRVTNPWNAQVAYTHDANGRITDVRGTDVNGAATYMGVANYATDLRYRASGGLKGLNYSNGRTLALAYDERLRLSMWNVAGVLGYEYFYDNAANPSWVLADKGHRVTYAKNISSSSGSAGTPSPDPTLDRSFDYDQVGRLQYSHSGVEARMHVTGQPNDGGGYGPYSHHYNYDTRGNLTSRIGWGGANPSYTATYTNNRRNGLSYDTAGNVIHDGFTSFQYDATGQQTFASSGGMQQEYAGDRLRVKKVEQGVTTYYLRSSVLGGPVVAEMDAQGTWSRGYVYLGAQLLAIQQNGVKWVHQDPVVKSQRVTDAAGAVTAVVELDPWGGETNRSWQPQQQPRQYTSYERDANGEDEAMHRRYNRWWSRFSQPDPDDGSYDLTDPQSFNRYSYVQNDPVNFVDPSGLDDDEVYRVYTWAQGPDLSFFYQHLLMLFDSGTPQPFTAPDPGTPQETTHPGGTPNPIAQLGPCPELVVPAFGAINQAAAMLLKNTYGSGAEAAYGRLSTYEKAVFLNTAAGAASVGVNFSNAKFDHFYRSDKPGNLPYGIYVTGASGKLEGRHRDIGSVELDTRKGVTQIDIDLFKGGLFNGKHHDEVRFNNKHNRPTHPGDVTRQLTARGVNSGVSCKP